MAWGPSKGRFWASGRGERASELPGETDFPNPLIASQEWMEEGTFQRLLHRFPQARLYGNLFLYIIRFDFSYKSKSKLFCIDFRTLQFYESHLFIKKKFLGEMHVK